MVLFKVFVTFAQLAVVLMKLLKLDSESFVQVPVLFHEKMKAVTFKLSTAKAENVELEPFIIDVARKKPTKGAVKSMPVPYTT
jgi:hypothetical protein